MDLTIGPADPEALTALADMAARSFCETYAWYNPEPRLQAYVRNNLQVQHFRASLEDPASILLTAARDGEPLAYVLLGPGETPAAVTARPAIELKRFYVATALHGKGVAAPLMEAALAAVRARGLAAVWLGVWEENPRATAFYRKWGFEAAGTVPFQFEDDPQTDILMVRSPV